MRFRRGLGRGGQRAKGKWILPQAWAVRDAQDEEGDGPGEVLPLEHLPSNWPP